jgi:hypothetical protein
MARSAAGIGKPFPGLRHKLPIRPRNVVEQLPSSLCTRQVISTCNVPCSHKHGGLSARCHAAGWS